MTNSKRAARYIRWRLKRRTDEQARREYIAEVAPPIRELGLRVPDESADRHFL